VSFRALSGSLNLPLEVFGLSNQKGCPYVQRGAEGTQRIPGGVAPAVLKMAHVAVMEPCPLGQLLLG
jgi:hypothetical protein